MDATESQPRPVSDNQNYYPNMTTKLPEIDSIQKVTMLGSEKCDGLIRLCIEALLEVPADQAQRIAEFQKQLLFALERSHRKNGKALQKPIQVEKITSAPVPILQEVKEDSSLPINEEMLLDNASLTLENWYAIESSSVKWMKVVTYLKALDSKIGTFVSNYHGQKYLGMNLFISLWKLNESLGVNGVTDVKRASADYADSIITAVTLHQQWIRDFIYKYGTREIDLFTGVPTTWVCGIRSGIQFLFDAFYGYSDEFDDVLNSFNEDISEFDSRMETWVDCGCRDPLRPKEIPTFVPPGHLWWF